MNSVLRTKCLYVVTSGTDESASFAEKYDNDPPIEMDDPIQN